MKQLTQHIRSGKTLVAAVPAPQCQPGKVLVRAAASLVSAGTERMIVEFANKNLAAKARARPDLVRQTLDKARREGLLTTFDAVQNRLDEPMALGYSVSGTVIDTGEGVSQFKIGDRVAAAGAGQAVHAEVVAVPANLVAKIPDEVDFDSAAFTTLGAIALQGIRLSDAKLGEWAAVIGLGLLGQLAVQMLRAAGCRVLGMDPVKARAQLGIECGAEAVAASAAEFTALCAALTANRGADVVLITADTKSDEPVALAGEVARSKGVVVAVGAVGMELPRRVYYDKELDFRVSRSYGPGRYDPEYEERGRDYPYAYVRWTENRNMQAFLQLMAEKKVDAAKLITHRFPIAEGAKAYDLITGKLKEPFLGVLLTYPNETLDVGSRRIEFEAPGVARSLSGTPEVTVGLLGAGNFAKAVLLPALQKAGVAFAGVSTASGLSARHTADRFRFRYATTNSGEVLNDPAVNAVVIATRHHLHAAQTIAALKAGKHVFVEKPLCLTEDELNSIIAAQPSAISHAKRPSPILMVGFNRRFAPMAVAIKSCFADAHEAITVQYRVNAGYIPASHWTQDPAQGGGRLIGEAVHFIDFALWLTGSMPASVHAMALPNAGRYNDDNFALTIQFASGSIAQILYHANGDRAAGKERIEVHAAGRSAILDDFRRLELLRGGNRRVLQNWWRQDKGHDAECAAFARAVRNEGPPPIPFDEIVAVMQTAFAAARSLKIGQAVAVGSS